MQTWMGCSPVLWSSQLTRGMGASGRITRQSNSVVGSMGREAGVYGGGRPEHSLEN